MPTSPGTGRQVNAKFNPLKSGGIHAAGKTFAAAAPVTCNDLKAIGDANLGRIGEHRQPAPHLRMGDGIVIEVEANIGRLARLDGDLLDEGIGMIRQRHEARRFFGDAEGIRAWTAAVRGNTTAPVCGLSCFIECASRSSFQTTSVSPARITSSARANSARSVLPPGAVSSRMRSQPSRVSASRCSAAS